MKLVHFVGAAMTFGCGFVYCALSTRVSCRLRKADSVATRRWTIASAHRSPRPDLRCEQGMAGQSRSCAFCCPSSYASPLVVVSVSCCLVPHSLGRTLIPPPNIQADPRDQTLAAKPSPPNTLRLHPHPRAEPFPPPCLAI